MDLEGKTVGRKQASGFINAYNIEPITYRPNENFSVPNTKVSIFQQILVFFMTDFVLFEPHFNQRHSTFDKN